jgi:regulator of sigma E protease
MAVWKWRRMSVLWSIVGFVVVIGILVTIHEWGHYQAARWFNIKVVRFSIGFGRPIWRRQGKETEFQVAMIPLGGYVKFVDEAEGNVSAEDLPRAYNRQSVYKRFAVVAAGPVVNLLFAWIAFTAIYLIGITGIKPIFDGTQPQSALESAVPDLHQAWLVTEVDRQPVTTWLSVREALLKALVADQSSISLSLENLQTGRGFTIDALSLKGLDLSRPQQDWLATLGFKPFEIPFKPVVGSVAPNSPTYAAGITQGDRIVSINEHEIRDWREVVEAVRDLANETARFILVRQGETVLMDVKLDSRETQSGEPQGYLGVGVQVSPEEMAVYSSTQRYGLFESLTLGLNRGLDLAEMTLVMIKKMLFGQVGVDNLSGPVSIAQFSGQALQSGLIAFLGLLGLLSLSLGILNLLPIPVLDGGHLLYYLIEMIKGSPLNESVMMLGQKIGLVLILGLTILALTNDILRITNG